MQCKNCGRAVTSGSKYCPQCKNNMQHASDFGIAVAFVVTILLIVSMFMPWISIDFLLINGDYNFFESTKYWNELEYPVFTWIIYILSLLLAIMHAVNLWATVRGNERFLIYNSDSGAWTLVFSVCYVILIFILEKLMVSELTDNFLGNLFNLEDSLNILQFRWGFVLFVALAVAEYLIFKYLDHKANE